MNDFSRHLKTVELALAWVRLIEEGEIIETKDCGRNHFNFNAGDEREAFDISRAVNHVLMTFSICRYVESSFDKSSNQGQLTIVR